MAIRRSPIAFFAYNRPAHATRTLAALAANPEAAVSDLHVFVDGARTDEDRNKVAEVVGIARGATGFGSITVHASATNAGLFRAITDGVTQVLSSSDRVIVVEDDILVSPRFLAYMNECLERFEKDSAVGSVHGYSPPLSGLPEFFFLRGADCWGWATWADRWALFDADAQGLLRTLLDKGWLSEFAKTHGWQSVLHLVRRAQHRNHSWAILWHASLFLAGRHTLHPGRSLVENIGHDGTGAHSRESTAFSTVSSQCLVSPPLAFSGEDPQAAKAISAFMDSTAIHRLPQPIGRVALRWYATLLARVQGWH